MTAPELSALCGQAIKQLQAGMDAYDERAAIQEAAIESQMKEKSTTDLAIDVLQRSERFNGEHDVARAWLRTREPHVHVFIKGAS